jgi:hypothetical protein
MEILQREVEAYRAFFQKIKDAVSCVVCEELLREPRVLGCGHTVCSLCVAQIKEKRCPTCRETYKRGAITKNYTVAGMADACDCFEKLSLDDDHGERKFLTAKRSNPTTPTGPRKNHSQPDLFYVEQVIPPPRLSVLEDLQVESPFVDQWINHYDAASDLLGLSGGT